MSRPSPAVSQHVGFLILPNVALMSLAAATEPLRAANLIAGDALRRELAEAGRAHVNAFTWHNAALKSLRFFERITG